MPDEDCHSHEAAYPPKQEVKEQRSTEIGVDAHLYFIICPAITILCTWFVPS